jgi:hypothetical protein
VSGKRARPGRTGSLGPPEGQPWFWMTRTMLGAITYRALSIHARRVLEFLLMEHMGHAGRENGNLGASYLQLEAWGVSTGDVSKGIGELEAAGFIRCTWKAKRQAHGTAPPSTYALTWYPTHYGTRHEGKATHDWLDVIVALGKGGIGTVAGARQWLKEQTSDVGRGKRRRARALQLQTSHLSVVPPDICEAGEAA